VHSSVYERTIQNAFRDSPFRHCIMALFAMAFIVFITTTLAPTTQAAQTIPYKVNFQGRLTDATGNVKPNGLYNIKFRLMSAASGGTNLWQADRVYGVSDHRIQVTNGLFNVQLGDTTLGDPALSPALFNTLTNAAIFLEVELPTPGTATCASSSCATFSEGAMTPRSPLGAAAYAFNADTVDGIDGASLAQLSANNTFTGTMLHRNASNSTTAFQIQNAAGDPLLVADTSNYALKVGGGDVSPSGTPALLVLDHKNSAGDPTGTNGAMYYNTTVNKFRCYEGGSWGDCTTPINDPRKGFIYQQDFTLVTYPASGQSFDTVLYSALANMTLTNLASETNHPGIMRLTTTSTAAVGGAWAQVGPVKVGGTGAWSMLTNVRLPLLSDGTTVTVYRAGFFNSISTTTESGITNGCYLRYSHSGNGANTGNWQGVCRRASAESVCDTGATVVGNTWDSLNITLNSAGTLATFTANGVNQCTLSTDIPLSSTQLAFGSSYQKTAGAAVRTAHVDYMDVRSVLTR
jgi:hypothetical protein